MNVPEGWQETRLSELGDIVRGRGLTRADLASHGVPCLRYGEIYTRYGDTTDTLHSFVSPLAAGRATPLRSGDIVFASSGETREDIGKAVAWLGKDRAVVGGDTLILREHGQDPTFLVHVLNSESATRQKIRLGKGYAVVHIHAADLESILIAIPPISIQRRATRLLVSWDKALDALRALRAALERQQRALLARLIQAPALDLVRESWRRVRLGDVVEVISSSVDKKKVDGEHAVRLCNYMDVYNNDTVSPSMTGLMRATATASEIRRFALVAGDVIITKDSEDPTDIAVSTFVEAGAPDFVCGYHLAILRPGSEVDGRFLKSWLDLPASRAYFGSRANGVTRFGLTVDSMRDAVINLPPLPEQRRIAAIIATWGEAISGVMAEEEAVKRQRQAVIAHAVGQRVGG